MRLRQAFAGKLVPGLMALALFAVASPSSVFAASDLTGHWAAPQIRDWINEGIVTGYPDGSFKPNADVTRAEFMAMVNKAFHLTGKGQINYVDVSDSDWFAGIVKTASASGYINGYPDGRMGPNSPISRLEAAVVIAKVSGRSETESDISVFKDASEVPDWAKNAIGTVLKNSFMGGYPDGSFGGEKSITRAEAVSSLSRSVKTDVVNRVYSESGTYGAPIVETIAGNVTITDANVQLKNMVIKGDLSIPNVSGEGDISLENVLVEGSCSINGDGIRKILINDCMVDQITVSGNNSALQMVVSGASEINQILLKSDIYITENRLGSFGIDAIDIEAGIKANLAGTNISELGINSVGATLFIGTNSSIDWLNVNKSSQIHMASNSIVSDLVANAAARVTGMGIIKRADINSIDVKFESKPNDVIVKQGMTNPTYITPVIESFSPADGSSKVPLSANIVIKFSQIVRMTEDTKPTSENLKYMITISTGLDGKVSIPFKATINDSGDKTTVTVNPTEDLLPDQDYSVSVVGFENDENKPLTGTNMVAFRTVSLSPPHIESFIPQMGSSNVLTGENIVVTFSEIVRNINNTVLTNSNVDSHIIFKKTDSNGALVAFDATVADVRGKTIITIDPKYNLANASTYYIQITGIEDETDRAAIGTLSETFVTVPDKAPPVVKSISPPNGTESVPLNAPIIITFYDILYNSDGAVLTDNNIDVMVTMKTSDILGDNVIFDATVRMVNGRIAINVDPVADLIPGQSYYVSVDGLVDSYGQRLSGVRSSVFTAVEENSTLH